MPQKGHCALLLLRARVSSTDQKRRHDGATFTVILSTVQYLQFSSVLALKSGIHTCMTPSILLHTARQPWYYSKRRRSCNVRTTLQRPRHRGTSTTQTGQTDLKPSLYSYPGCLLPFFALWNQVHDQAFTSR
ncbi:unnamed protein product [Ectocarpus sp. 4 AP-2014]